MKRFNIKITLLFAAAALVGGCETDPARYSAGPIKAHTFNFVRMTEEKQPSYSDNRPEVHAIIQSAVENDLVSKGLAKVESDGDVNVLYLIIISDGTSTRAINDYYGYGDSAYALQDKAHQAFAIDKRNLTAFDAGTLVIEIVDPHQGTVLWRNFVYRPILRDLPIEQRQARIQEAVNETLKNLRVAK